MKILVALDGSRYTDAITNMLIVQLKTDADVRLLHVVEPFPVKLAEAEGSRERPDFEQARLDQRDAAQRWLEAAVRKLRAAGFAATWSVLEGEPRAVILDDADVWKADLIVVGSHGHGRTGLQRWLMGSVSESVARHATCSVEIVRIPNA